MKKIIYSTLLVLASAPTMAAKPDFSCIEQPGTRQTMCFMKHEVRLNRDGHRIAPLYEGGPDLVSPTPYFIVADCNGHMLYLRDRQGRSFASGSDKATPQSDDQFASMCATSLTQHR
jgi:hypothetical protein